MALYCDFDRSGESCEIVSDEHEEVLCAFLDIHHRCLVGKRIQESSTLIHVTLSLRVVSLWRGKDSDINPIGEYTVEPST